MGRKKVIKSRKITFLVGGIVIVLIVAIIYFGFIGNQKVNTVTTDQKPVMVNPDNLPVYLESISIINDLPNDAEIQLNFGELSYAVTKGEVRKGYANKPDVIVYLPDKYIGRLGYGVCGALKEAINKGDLGYDTYLSDAKLLWKYKKMLKYKDCVGG